MTSANVSNVFGDDKVSYNPDTSTLTLKGYTYEGDGYSIGYIGAAIYYGGTDTLNLVPVGENSVTHSGNSNGVYANGNITASGDGSLTAIGGERTEYSYGVYANGTITIESGEVVAHGETQAFHTAPTIADTFDAAVWYDESEDSANAEGAKDISELAGNYNRKYVKIAPVITYTITFDPNGGSVEPETMETVGYKLESLPTPTRSGYKFQGWYEAETGGNRITTDTVFAENTTVYAHWKRKSSVIGVGGSSNTTTTPTKNDDGSTTTVETKKEFDDVHPVNHWATADIDYVFEKGLMNGVSENMFSPDGAVTRAEIAVILHRFIEANK